MERFRGDKIYTEDELTELFSQDDFGKLSFHILRQIKTAMLTGAYYDGHLGITGKTLISDDARQFSNIFDSHILCWYHELRHFKEIVPLLDIHQNLLREFFDEAKLLYRAIKSWVNGERRPEAKEYLSIWFNNLFSSETGFDLLDEQKRRSLAKRDKLLAPLSLDIKVPLENNESERDIRGRVIKRKISIFNRTLNGAKAWDLYISLKQTCRKLGVSYWRFLVDRLINGCEVPRLGSIICAI